MTTTNEYKSSFGRAPFRNLRKVSLRWLKGVFSTFNVGEYKYIENSPDSEIEIHAAVPVKFDISERRPCIVYQRLHTGWNNPGFGAGPLVQDTRLGSASQRKTSLISGQLGFHCCSKTPDEAEDLAWIVSFWLRECLPLLSRLGFHHLSEPIVHPVTPAPDAIIEVANSEWIICTVALPFSYQYSWNSVSLLKYLQELGAYIVSEDEELSQEISTKE